MSREERRHRLSTIQLWFISDRQRTRYSLVQTIARSLQAGLPAVLIRERDLGGGAFSDITETVACAAQKRSAQVSVSNRSEIAVSHGCGVHLSAGVSSPAVVREKLPGNSLLGVSIHTTREAEETDPDTVDYVFAAPVFETVSKPGATPLGLTVLSQICAVSRVPVFALGGVTAERIPDCLGAGAHGVAVIGSIAESEDPAGSTRELLEAVDASEKGAAGRHQG